MEERLAKIEGIVEQMDKRLGRVESELSELRVDGIREKLDSNFKWTVGILLSAVLPMWLGILAILLKR